MTLEVPTLGVAARAADPLQEAFQLGADPDSVRANTCDL